MSDMTAELDALASQFAQYGAKGILLPFTSNDILNIDALIRASQRPRLDEALRLKEAPTLLVRMITTHTPPYKYAEAYAFYVLRDKEMEAIFYQEIRLALMNRKLGFSITYPEDIWSIVHWGCPLSILHECMIIITARCNTEIFDIYWYSQIINRHKYNLHIATNELFLYYVSLQENSEIDDDHRRKLGWVSYFIFSLYVATAIATPFLFFYKKL